MSTAELRRHAARRTAACALAAAAVLPTGCSALSGSSAGDGMRWVGQDASDEAVTLPVYRAVEALPDLSAPDAARALGLPQARAADPSVPGAAADDGSDELQGPGWTVAVTHGVAGTSVRMHRRCGEARTTDPARAVQATKEALRALGGDPAAYTWFTVPDVDGRPRALGEPTVEGSATWATGLFTAAVSDRRVCAVSGTLMAFERTDEAVALPSAADAFARARDDESLAVAGSYASAEPTWTLEAGGRVVPAWRFVGAERTVVMVDLGDGWETALDTESYLEDQAGA